MEDAVAREVFFQTLINDVVFQQVLLADLGVGFDERLRIRDPRDLDEPDVRLDRLALTEVLTEGDTKPRDFVILLEPVLEQALRHRRRACVGFNVLLGVPGSPGIDRGPDLRHEKEPARPAAGFVHAPSLFNLHVEGLRGVVPEDVDHFDE